MVIAERIGYPVLVRPSYVLGGRGMETCFDEDALRRYMSEAVDASELADAPVLIDRFLSEAIEIDVDVVADFGSTEAPQQLVCGVMEHIEEAGIHSGDSSCTLPPISMSKSQIKRVAAATEQIARGLNV